jgi:predicted dehydrogenase
MSRVKIAVVGCGYWGQNLIRNFSDIPNVDVTAVCDFNLNALARVKRRYPSIELRQDYQQILADWRIHAVVIATPVATHYSFAERALRAGKHVLVEQPLATSSRQALALMELADKHGRTLMVDHTFVYTGAVRQIKALVDARELGDLLYFDSVRISLGMVQSDTNVVWDLAPHDFSMLDHLCSKQPVAVTAIGAKSLGHPFENIAYLAAHFEGQMSAHIQVNWLAPVKVRKTLVGGTKRTVVYDDMEPVEKVRMYDNAFPAGDDLDPSGYWSAGHRSAGMFAPILDTTEALSLMAREFVDSITEKRLPISDGYAGYRVVRLLEAAQQSLQQEGRTIEVADAFGLRKAAPSCLEAGARDVS